MNPKVKVLATLDETSYKGGKNGANHPIAWYHEFDGGRAFYTAGGHTSESYSEPLFLAAYSGRHKIRHGEIMTLEFKQGSAAVVMAAKGRMLVSCF